MTGLDAGHRPPLQVLLVASTLDDDGGIPVCVAQLAGGLQRIGVDVTIVGQCSGTLAPALVELSGVGTVRVAAVQRPWHLAGQAGAALAIARLVARRIAAGRAAGRPTVVHAHGIWVAPVIAALQTALAHGAGVVISPHGMLRRDALRKSRWRKQAVLGVAVRRLLAAAGSLQATSAAEADDLARLLPGCHPTIVPLGIEPVSLPERAARSPAVRTAGYLGRLLPIKNLDGLLRAWSAARPRGWRLVLAGPGEASYVDELRRLAHALGIDGAVDFLPAVPRSAIGGFLGGLDLFVLASRSEAFSLVVGEALAAGVPVVASTAAPWEGVRSAGCGWSVEPDPDPLTAALLEATATPPADLSEMGRRGAEWIRREYDWVTVARRHVAELYEPALGAVQTTHPAPSPHHAP